jgi:2'-hydroxyisoflavone reductase
MLSDSEIELVLGMRLLILGGTIFLGRHLAEAALARGHQLTLFNRGRHYPAVFPEVERIVGDRRGDLEGLRGRSWDAVIDTSGHVPRVVRTSAKRLAGAVKHYTFISSVLAYEGFPKTPGLDENSPLGAAANPATEEVAPDNIGPLKALCEMELENTLPGQALIIRAGFIFGPWDPTGRSGYWIHRISQGAEVLAPGKPDRPLQMIDVRDLAEWILSCAEDGRTGIYNATGPSYPSTLTLERFLQTCEFQCRSGAQFTWISDSFLVAAGVRPGVDLPFWMPGGVSGVNCHKGISAGLTFRSLEEIVRNVVLWYADQRPYAPQRAGITRERESQLLRAWHAESKGLVPEGIS